MLDGAIVVRGSENYLPQIVLDLQGSLNQVGLVALIVANQNYFPADVLLRAFLGGGLQTVIGIVVFPGPRWTH